MRDKHRHHLLGGDVLPSGQSAGRRDREPVFVKLSDERMPPRPVLRNAMIGPDAEIQRLGSASRHSFFDCRRLMVHGNAV